MQCLVQTLNISFLFSTAVLTANQPQCYSNVSDIHISTNGNRVIIKSFLFACIVEFTSVICNNITRCTCICKYPQVLVVNNN